MNAQGIFCSREVAIGAMSLPESCKQSDPFLTSVVKTLSVLISLQHIGTYLHDVLDKSEHRFCVQEFRLYTILHTQAYLIQQKAAIGAFSLPEFQKQSDPSLLGSKGGATIFRHCFFSIITSASTYDLIYLMFLTS